MPRRPVSAVSLHVMENQMPRTYAPPINHNEQTIRDLESELYVARQAIIDLMPEQQRQILWSFFRCESREDTYVWKDKIAEELIGTAEVIRSYNSDRAYCPLCGDGSSSGYEPGYSVPVGLTRHLTGWGRVRECPVVAAASAIARNYWNEKFAPAEREQKAKNADLLVQRRSSEILFLVDPNGKPVLFDEKSYFGSGARSREEMSWAEKRLNDLHFRTLTVDRVKSYIDEQDRYLVYADPRAKGRIEFTAYVRPALKKTKGAKVKYRSIGTFRIPDTWKNDLFKKYKDWVVKATAELIERPR
jgi:hypothetical protein